MRSQQQRHRELIEDQDEQIEEIGNIADQLKYHAQDINKELKAQENTVQQVDEEMDRTYAQLSKVEQKLADIMKTNDPSTLRTIMTLTCVLISLILVIIVF